MNEIELLCTLTCPICGFSREEQMPTNSCRFFYECESCHTMLEPQHGDCCVFCSYGDIKCPPIQSGAGCP